MMCVHNYDIGLMKSFECKHYVKQDMVEFNNGKGR